ncbi:MAG: ACP phosphodiesterase [Ginsengibacter sp.]
MLFLQMNYLAHAYLSFDEPEILTGNMISDFVKGKTKYSYSDGIQKGIHLHRSIDNFTDFHPATAKAKNLLRKQYRLYAGAFVDVIYDHFLATDVNQFINYGNLEKFSQQVFDTLDNRVDVMPERFQLMYPHMKSHNWLYNYRLKEGIQKSFAGLAWRAAYLSESEVAFKIFNDHYEEFKSHYEEFFPDVKKFARDNLSNLLAN